MALAMGKAQLATMTLFLGLLTSLGIGIVLYTTQENGVTYTATLSSINTDYENVWGTVKIKITNDNGFDVSFTNVNIEMADPSTEVAFYTYGNSGGTIDADGGTFEERIDFSITYDDIPENEVLVRISGLLTWDGNEEAVNYEIIIPLVWEF